MSNYNSLSKELQEKLLKIVRCIGLIRMHLKMTMFLEEKWIMIKQIFGDQLL